MIADAEKIQNGNAWDSLMKATKNYGILLAIFLLGLVYSFASPYFFGFDNFRNILLQSSPIAIVTIGQAFILLTGEFDLSLGQNVCFSSCLAAYLMKFSGWNPWVSVLAGLLAGTAVGLLNGVLIAYGKLPCFIATLGTQNISKGLAKIITNATPIPTLPQEISFLGRGYIGGLQYGLPVSVLIMLVLYIFFSFIARKTRYGRYLYAIGGGEESAFFSGINVKKYRLLNYTLAGFMAAFGGIVLLSRLNSASVTNGSLYEFDAIIASVIGGISLSGGRGRVLQAMFGAIFLTLFFNGMTMLDVHPFVQDVLKGVVLIVAIGIDVLRNRRRN